MRQGTHATDIYFNNQVRHPHPVSDNSVLYLGNLMEIELIPDSAVFESSLFDNRR